MMADKSQVTRMLKTARGQIDGILNMIAEDRYCIDISTQIQAAQALLGKANAEVLKAHVNHCVRAAAASGDSAEADKKLEEIALLLEKLAKR